jgi:hypothetical protein
MRLRFGGNSGQLFREKYKRIEILLVEKHGENANRYKKPQDDGSNCQNI